MDAYWLKCLKHLRVLYYDRKKWDVLFGQAGTQSLKGKRIQKARVKDT